ncbi:MAG TPA: peptidoglycan bridge formation glycyltransferase FemA/FemB family protein [Candidatus Fimihabitans intestinipullorum]|uniref:Peptidoglycan bridge formation glycyltransferase FemA/FemB family protein n=1 Tax=Candidatus Fimihabitans intestinipullorum TaxID=2840820 RepID=A0A9D1HTD2_9BACT|nr:peptidoglycan bridge formation glycyltransferase FemA/FemB family protein [Candidatus Fimihabitans intestinipullorum]
MSIKELSTEEFNLFIDAFQKTNMYQTSEYALAMSHQEYQSLLLGLVDERSNIYGATLVLVEKLGGFKYATVPRGFLIDYNNTELISIFTKEIKKYLGKKDIIAVKIAPMIERMRYQINEKTKTPIANYDATFDALKKNGYFHMGYNHYFESLLPRYEAELKLNVPYYTLFEQLSPELQEHIRFSEQMGVKIYKGNQNHLEYLYLEVKDEYPRDLNFLRQFYQYFDTKQAIEFYYAKLDTEIYLKKSQELYQEYEARSNELNGLLLRQDLSKEKVINEKMRVDRLFDQYKNQLIQATNLLREYPKGVILSSLLIVKHKKTIYTVLDGYNHQMKEFSARHLLFWKVIEKYSRLGFETFNFGGVANPTLAENKMKEINDFKTSFHTEIVEYIGDLELITNAPLYFMYRNTAPLKNIFNRS